MQLFRGPIHATSIRFFKVEQTSKQLVRELEELLCGYRKVAEASTTTEPGFVSQVAMKSSKEAAFEEARDQVVDGQRAVEVLTSTAA